MTSQPVLEPYAVWAPSGARPLGVAPFLLPGDVVLWRYRDHSWEPGKAETASPMRVVRDDSSLGERFVRDGERVQARSRRMTRAAPPCAAIGALTTNGAHGSADRS